jgi:DNA repair ATPase RecN
MPSEQPETVTDTCDIPAPTPLDRIFTRLNSLDQANREHMANVKNYHAHHIRLEQTISDVKRLAEGQIEALENRIKKLEKGQNITDIG